MVHGTWAVLVACESLDRFASCISLSRSRGLIDAFEELIDTTMIAWTKMTG